MPPPGGFVSGIVLKCFAADGETKVYINVCGHPSVGLPLTKSMDPIPDAQFLDVHGLDNLIVPISVGDPVHHKRTSDLDSGKMIIVDVVIHMEIIRRLVPEHRKYEDLVQKVTALALEWVTQETGVQLSARTVKLLPHVKYKEAPVIPSATQKLDDSEALDPAARKESEERIRKHANELYEQLLRETSQAKPPASSAAPTVAPLGSQEDSSIRLPSHLNLGAGSSRTDSSSTAAAPKRAMVTELPPQGPVIKKGFLNQPNARLYDDGGSKEGVLPDGAGDPLGYLPKGLREKCKVIDTRVQQEAPKATAKVTLPFTVGGPGEVTGDEFLQQLAVVDKVMSGGDPNALRDLTVALQREMPPVAKTEEPRHPHVTPSSVPCNGAAAAAMWSEDITTTCLENGTTQAVIRLSPPEHVKSMKDIDIDAEAEFVVVNGHRVRPPFLIDVDSVAAKFVKSSRTLVVTCCSAR